jgi:LuxR family transcriptional regulator, maltose regulon positive regulatory protein
MRDKGLVPRLALFDRLQGAARVTMVSASPGSGKTVLLRSWIRQAGLAKRTAWVTAGDEGGWGGGRGDAQRFWLSVLGELRETAPGAGLVQPVSAAPDLDGWTIVERLLTDLAPLDEPVWLVIDDVHELGSDLVLRQLELLVLRAPSQLRFVLASRHDLKLGQHRLRLAGELTEFRAADLRFSPAEARELFDTAGLDLPEPAVALLCDRTEGWAAGLRMAVLLLAGHPDPYRFAEEFSGSERTVAEYLMAEALDRQPEPVRRLLLRTSILERVNGELADLLTGGTGGERILQDLEQANAFVVSLDASRTWFRCHQLFTDLKRLELRRTMPGEVTGLHRAAAGWFAGHGYPVEAIRHLQAAGDWEQAARLLADHWPGLHLGGQAGAVHELLAGFPDETRAADAELATLCAGDELASGSLEMAERYLALAERGSQSVQAGRHGQFEILLGIVRLLLARQRGNPVGVAQEARRLNAVAEADPGPPVLGEELRALALINLGATEVWNSQLAAGERHLEQGIVLARRIGRPFLEFSGLAYQAAAQQYRSPFGSAAECGRKAIDLAQRHGWTDEPAAGPAYLAIAGTHAWQGRPEEAEPWIQRAERTVTTEAEPVTRLAVHYVRGRLELTRGRYQDALTAFRAAERLAGRLTEQPAGPILLVTRTRVMLVYVLVRLGDTAGAERVLDDLGEHDRERAELGIAVAELRLAQDDPGAATAALAPLTSGSVSVDPLIWMTHAFLLEAIARDALGDPVAAGRALERALDLAEPDGALSLFLLHPAPALLGRHARSGTAHASFLAEILALLAGQRVREAGGGPPPLMEALSDSEIRVLRYLPTNLPGPQIAGELRVSYNTVKTHLRHLYAKFGTSSRADTVTRARDLGLLAPQPSARRR